MSCARNQKADKSRLGGFDCFGRNLEFGRILKMLLDRAQLRRLDQRRTILLREIGRNLDFQVDLANHAVHRVGMNTLHDAHALGRDTALLAETQYVNTGAGTNR